ncbi:cytochrome c oxidase assembly protein [Aeromicrobium piscarium]|uniref:Cytochrome c oxidase assembly protein n=1 Tax=Aeromicrobium piscarium TaxID=2590901 RepID=A0A554RFT9_9ACTN|nr:cytochrome c oxidase assembly protein [Aeromicrobium piscarium]TSD52971.1 cytochrome c oxidase assembly protein [Aeromicrobium piscarium]
MSAEPFTPVVPGRRPAGRMLTFGLFVAVIAVPVIVTIVLGEDANDRRDYPGSPTTGAITAAVRAIADMSAVLTLGAVVSALFLQRLRISKQLRLTDSFDVRVLRGAAGLWMVSAAASVLLEAVDSNGMSLPRLLEDGAFWHLVSTSLYARAWFVAAVAAMAIVVITYFSYLWWHLLLPLVLTIVGILAPVIVGSVLVGPNHDFGGDAAVIMTVLSLSTLGCWTIQLFRIVAGEPIAKESARRLVVWTVMAMPMAITAEVVIVWFKLAGTSLTGGLAGWFSLVRLVSLVGIWAIAFVLWRRDRDDTGTVVGARAVFSIVSLGAASVAAQVAMTRFLSPQYDVETSLAEIFLGFDLPDSPSLAVLLGQWRLNLLFSTIAVALMVAYGLGLRRLRHQGDRWPVGRSAAWFAGCLLLIAATSSGFGKYSGADFAVHMGVHMVLNMLVPLLLVLGGAVTLALRVTRTGEPAGPHEWITGLLSSPLARVIYHPLVVFVVFVGSYYALYLTGLFEQMVRSHWSHQLMNAHFLLIGYLYYGLAVGVDRVPHRLPHIARLGFVFAAMPFHAFFGVIIMSMGTIIAAEYYAYLDMSWSTDLLATQRLGGGIAWAGGEIPLLIVVLTLAAQWALSDAREARRKDRHFDTGRDDEFEAYNRMLDRLAERPSTRNAPGRRGDKP